MVLAAHHLGQAELRDVAADRGLGDLEAEAPQQRRELPLAADGGRPTSSRTASAAGRRGSIRPVRVGDVGAQPGRPEMRVPKVGSSSARASAWGAAASQMIASAPSPPIAASAALTLGTMPPRIVPSAISASASAPC